MLLCGGNKGKKALTFYLCGGKVTIRQPGHRSPALLFCIPASPDYGARKINRNGSVRLKEIIKKISDVGIIPVVKLKDEKDALPLARALCDGGLPAAEVTFRTDAAENVIKAMAEAFPDMLVGAGTVLTVEQAKRAKAAGAKFMVSPGFNSDVVSWCISEGFPVIPGVCTPSDVEKALSMGLEYLKFFPAEACGGLSVLKAMSGPYGNVRFLPTGGINEKNVMEYLSFPKVFACGGSFMVSEKLIASGDFDSIKEHTARVASLMLGYRLAHIGINCPDSAGASAAADFICAAFGFDRMVCGDVSVFSGDFEFMNAPGRGTMGHIAIGTNSVDRAVFSLGRKGVKFDMSSAKYSSDGSLEFIYIADEVCGFAIHLVKNPV